MEMNKLQREFYINIRAVQPALMIRTSEPHDALLAMMAVAKDKEWESWRWSIKDGLLTPDDKKVNFTPAQPTGGGLAGIQPQPSPAATLILSLDHLMAIDNIDHNAAKLVGGDIAARPTILFIQNGHRFLEPSRQPDNLIQTLQNVAEDGKDRIKHVVLIAHRDATLPPELEPMFTIIDHQRPSTVELTASLADILHNGEELGIDDTEKTAIVEAGKGLTRFQFEGTVARCLVENKNALDAGSVWRQKVEIVNRSRALKLYRGTECFNDLGGMTGLKNFCLKSLDRSKYASKVEEARPRGVLLYGVPGTGKSAFCKALGNELGYPSLMMDVGAMYGSLVGQTEAAIREALELADLMAPCILYVD
jgi:ATPase family associated with various cellular activities (AAA)